MEDEFQSEGYVGAGGRRYHVTVTLAGAPRSSSPMSSWVLPRRPIEETAAEVVRSGSSPEVVALHVDDLSASSSGATLVMESATPPPAILAKLLRAWARSKLVRVRREGRQSSRLDRMQAAKREVDEALRIVGPVLPDRPLGPSVLWVDRAVAQAAMEVAAGVGRARGTRAPPRSWVYWVTGAGEIGSLMQGGRARLAGMVREMQARGLPVQLARLGRNRRSVLVVGGRGEVTDASVGGGRWLVDEHTGEMLRAVTFDDLAAGLDADPRAVGDLQRGVDYAWTEPRTGRRVLVVPGEYGSRSWGNRARARAGPRRHACASRWTRSTGGPTSP